MIKTEDGLATVSFSPLGINQRPRIYLEMPIRVFGYILGCTAGADPALATKEDSADFLLLGRAGQLLQIRQHRA